MKKEINISIKALYKEIYIIFIVIGAILMFLSIIPTWLLGLVFIATGCLGIILNEFNKGL